MRAEARREHAIPLMERLLPERHERKRAAIAVLVTAPHVVDEDIEPPMIRADPAKERLDVRIIGVVAPDGDAATAAVRHVAGGLVDRARHIVRGRCAVDASTAEIHGRAGGAQLEGDAASRAAARSSDQRDDVAQLCHRRRNASA